jgi:hypothetical protein
VGSQQRAVGNQQCALSNQQVNEQSTQQLLSSNYSAAITQQQLLGSNYSAVADCLLQTTDCLLLPAHCWLLTAGCILLAADPYLRPQEGMFLMANETVNALSADFYCHCLNSLSVR